MLHFDTTLIDGHRIAIRPFVDGDEDTVQEIFDEMSLEARYHRFLQATPRLSPRLRAVLASVDGKRHRAAVAWDGDRPVGVVRLVTDREGAVELSVSIVDRFTGRGLGTLLSDAALAVAGCDVTILVHPENHRAVKLFRKLGFRLRFDGSALLGCRPAEATGVAA